MADRAIPPALLTSFADLMEQLKDAEAAATPYRRSRGGIAYLYAKQQVAARRKDIFIGRGDDPEAVLRAESLSRGAAAARQRRRHVRLLRGQGLWGPEPWLGRVIEALAAAGLFEQGALLVGTGAFQLMEPLLERFLPRPTLMTGDLDVATATLALQGPPDATFEQILQSADPSFAPIMQLHKKRPPSRFRADDGHLVELLTGVLRRTDETPMPLPALGAGAAPLPYMRWLIEEPVWIGALWGAGVLVRIPQPARYAVHKLIVAQRRDPANRVKRTKDLQQAGIIMEALRTSDPYALEDALDDARAQGKEGWVQPIARSLSELGLDL